MNRINIKPMTINRAWKGRRFKTDEYRSWRTEMFYTLPKIEVPDPPFKVSFEFGFSTKNSDIDNPVKCCLDAIQDKYRINDRDVYRLEVEKKMVKKGGEYIKFKIENYEKIKP